MYELARHLVPYIQAKESGMEPSLRWHMKCARAPSRRGRRQRTGSSSADRRRTRDAQGSMKEIRFNIPHPHQKKPAAAHPAAGSGREGLAP